MKMKRIAVYPIIQTITSEDDIFLITYERGENEIFTVVDKDILKNYFLNFMDWYLLKPDTDPRTDREYFFSVWEQYIRSHESNFDMLFKALYSDYDPIDNYDIHEEFTHRPDGKNDTIKTEFVNDTTNKPTTSRKVATYASGEKDYETIENTGKTTTTSTTTLKATYTDTTHKHGNAGVMTTSEVIRQEANLRKTELASEIVMGGFVNDYLFYSGVII